MNLLAQIAPGITKGVKFKENLMKNIVTFLTLFVAVFFGQAPACSGEAAPALPAPAKMSVKPDVVQCDNDGCHKATELFVTAAGEVKLYFPPIREFDEAELLVYVTDTTDLGVKLAKSVETKKVTVDGAQVVVLEWTGKSAELLKFHGQYKGLVRFCVEHGVKMCVGAHVNIHLQ